MVVVAVKSLFLQGPKLKNSQSLRIFSGPCSTVIAAVTNICFCASSYYTELYVRQGEKVKWMGNLQVHAKKFKYVTVCLITKA